MSTTATDPLAIAALSAEQVAHYREQSFVIIRGALDPAAIDPLRDDVLHVLAARNQSDSWLAQTTEYLAGTPIDHLVNSPRLRALCGQAMGGAARVYMPFTAVKGPGMGPFHWHQDNQYTQHRGESCNCWFALSPMDATSGCLRTVPHSHLQGTLASKQHEVTGGRAVQAEPTEWVDCELRPGDAVLFSRLNVHGSAGNQLDRPRVAYAVQFHREDTEALFDDEWKLLSERPRFHTGPVDALTDLAATEG